MEKSRNMDIDILRGIGIISVVLGHAMNTDVFMSLGAEAIRKFVYLYHLPIFFFCSGYFFKCDSIVSCIKKIWKQYKILVGICLSSYIFIPIWVNLDLINRPTLSEIMHKSIDILLFREDGYYVGAMWFIPFMTTTLIMYSIFHLIFRNKKQIYLILMCCICGVVGIIMVSKYGVGKRFVFISMLMIPIMLIGELYHKYKERMVISTWMLLPVCLCMIFLNYIGQEIELSKGIIFQIEYRWLFYPVILCGILFCLLLKNIIMGLTHINVIVSKLGEASVYIMGYHFIIFKLIDAIIYKLGIFYIDKKAFPIGCPQLRIIYVIMGLLIPMILFGLKNIYEVIRKKESIKNKIVQN